MADTAKTPSRMKQLIPVLSFTAAYLVAAVAGSIAAGNTEFILYMVIMLILGSVVRLADRRVRFSQTIFWCLS